MDLDSTKEAVFSSLFCCLLAALLKKPLDGFPWNLMEDIIWHFVNFLRNKAGVLIKNRRV